MSSSGIRIGPKVGKTAAAPVVNTTEAMIDADMAAWNEFIDSVVEDIGDLAYAGPDLIKIRAQLMSILTPKELRFLITALLTRGANVTKIDDKTEETGLKRWKAITAKVNILSKAATKDDITLPRAGAALPDVCAYVLMANEVKFPTNGNKWFYFSSAPIFFSELSGADWNLWLEWANGRDKTINQGPGRKPKGNDEIVRYATIAWASQVIDAQRIAMIKNTAGSKGLSKLN